MQNEILFSEKQQFRQGWLILIMIWVNSIFVYGIYQQIFKKIRFGNNPLGDTSLIVVSILVFAMTIFIFSFKLETQITKVGIFIRYIPFHKTFKSYPWTAIEKSYIRQYSPIGEYGGWGVRLGANGKAYNVSGNMGLQLEFKDGKKILIGTNQVDDLQNALLKIKV